MNRIAVVVQARLGGTRFPGKIMMGLREGTLLQHVCMNANEILAAEYVLAIPFGDAIQAPWGWEVARGSENDVWQRFADALEHREVEHFVRICADSPLLNADLVNLMIREHIAAQNDITVWPEALPGTTGPVVRVDTFLANPPRTPYEHEHVHVHLLDEERFRVGKMRSPLTIDTMEDYLWFLGRM